MEEDFNPVVEQPFTQADSLQLQRLNQDLASITSKVNEGILYPQEADPEREDILKERQGLIARQQAAQLAARGQQRMHMQDEHANQVTMGFEATKAAANQFTQMMPLHIDPDTGEKTYFYPDGKGGFQPIQNKDQGSDTTSPIDHYLGTGDTGGDTGGGGEAPAAGATGQFTQTINNGANRTDVNFQDGKATGYTGSPMGAPAQMQPQQGQQPGPDFSSLGITPDHIQQAQSLAQLLTPKPFLTGNKAHDSVTMRKYHEDLDRTQRMVLANQMKSSQAAKAEQRVVDKENREKEKELTHKQQEDLYQKKLNELQKDVDFHRKENTIEKAPAYLQDREAMEEEAHKRAKRDMQRIYGKQWTGSEAQTPPAPEAKPQQDAPQPKPEIPAALNKMSAADIAAELQRRAAARQGPSPIAQAVTNYLDQPAINRRRD